MVGKWSVNLNHIFLSTWSGFKIQRVDNVWVVEYGPARLCTVGFTGV